MAEKDEATTAMAVYPNAYPNVNVKLQLQDL